MNERRARGRPRTFDKRDKLTLIRRAFWEKGFDATSLNDLCAVTGLTRPSLYAAFGDKEQMYLASLEEFAAQMQEHFKMAAKDSTDPEQFLVSFYRRALDEYFHGDDRALGCFVFSNAVANAFDNAHISALIARYLSDLDRALVDVFQRQSKSSNNELAKVLSSLATGTLINLAVRARAGGKRTALDRIAMASAKHIGASLRNA